MATSLLDWIIDLMRDGDAREAFNSNPQGAMATAGFTNVCGGDVQHAIIDEPSIREVQGASLPPASTTPDIKYIVNNYTVQPGDVAAAGGTDTTNSNVIDTPGDTGPNVSDIGDNNTVTQDETHTVDQTTTDDHTVTDNSTDNSADNSTDDHTRTLAHNIVSGDGSAGGDQIQDSTLSDIGQGVSGDGNTNILYLADVVDTGDVHVLSDLVPGNVADGVLNDSPIAQDVLHDGVNDSLNDLVHNLL